MWTDTEEAYLRANWGQHVRTADIGAAIGKGKNAVIGKARRLGLPPLASGYKRPDVPMLRRKPQKIRLVPKPPAPPRIAKPAPERASVVSMPPPPEIARVAGVLDLEQHHCRWPVGTGYCGAHKLDGRSYCPGHHARATTRPPEPRLRAYADPSARVFR